MNETRQSLIKVYAREDGKIVLVYGSSDSESVEQLNLECVTIDKEDVQEIAQALFNVE
jgi:hypothetical protein